MLIRSILISLALLISAPASAQTIFNNLADADFEDIINDFSGLLSHTSVSGADGLGDIFGFEFGLIGGVADTPGIERLSNDFAPGSDVSQIPHGGIYAAVTFPFSITGEVSLLPEIEAEDADLSNTSIAVKWTFSDMLDWPVDVAVKVSNTSNEFSFTQDQPAPGTQVKYESTIQSLGVIISKNFVLVEPYAGFSTVSAEGELSANNPIFASAAVSDTADVSGSSIFAGVNLNLLFFKLGIEAAQVFDNNKISAKTSFYF